MIVLELSPNEQAYLEQESQKQGMSINEYAISRLFPKPVKQKSIADMVKGKRLESFNDDPVAIQRAMRNE